MKFNIPENRIDLFDNDLRVGNVYKCKGGGKTRFWICVGFDDKAVMLVGINNEGIITSATSYGRHVFDNSVAVFRAREVVGFCESLEQLEFDITWRE